ncbi:MAG TPA: hypothetical protein VLS25_08470 [Dehalococcoidia bacterium]|nr:hypothetical protein [Dehalococcoidia bacterium]
MVLIVLLAAAVAGIVIFRVRDSTGGDNAPETAAPTGPTPPFGAGPVPPGLQTFAEFDPPLSIVFDTSWSSEFPPDNDEIALDGPVFLAISRPSMVVDDETGEFVPIPTDLIAWVGAQKKFDADPPVATTLGGAPAFRIDATAKEGIKTLAFNVADAILVGKGDRMRLIVADVNGTTVTALMIAPPPQFDAAVAAGEALLQTLRFEAGSS